MRLIDADELKAAITVDGYEHFSGCLSSSEVSLLEMVTDDIDEAPTIDSVPVVRCCQCKDGIVLQHSDFVVCHRGRMKKMDFCSYGERKEGAE